MKKILFTFAIVCLFQFAFAQVYSDEQTFTLTSFKFNIANDSSQTSGNFFNINNVVLRDSTYLQPLIYDTGIDGAGDYCLSSTGWTNGMNLKKNYYVSFSTTSYTDITVSCRMKSSPTGPRDFSLQYKIGVSGIWNDNIWPNQSLVLFDNFSTGNLKKFVLPPNCNNQPNIYVRWVMRSDTAINSGLVDPTGTSSIDNILIQGLLQDSCSFLEINKIKAKIVTGGLNFFRSNDSNPYLHCYEYPKDSGKTTIFCSALWIGGKNQGNLHLAGERYHGNGKDYYPGPVMDSIQYPSEVVNWNQLWKINKTEIDYHITHWNSTGYVMPAIISQWPVYANAALGINYYLAPFVDADSNGAYNPANGDYPKIRGDQAIYYIYNDSVYWHSETLGKRLGVEVHAMAYAYNTDPLLEKTVFMNYLVYNRSNRVYDSLYMGLFTDLDIGYAQDDYIGCDTMLNTYFGYNGDSIDGHGEPMAYGNNPPVQTVTLLNQPMTSFAYFNNTGGSVAISDPAIAREYYLLMKNYWIDGKHFCYGGMGHPQAGGDSTKPVRFMFPGYPNDSTQWNEVNAGNPPYDRRGVGLTGPLTLTPGQYISFDVAYITVDSGFAKSGGFPNVDNMLAIVPLIRDYFNNTHPQDGQDLALGIETKNPDNITPQFNVYPNPTNSRITFTTNLGNTKFRLDILDISGRLIQSYECKGTKKEMDVSDYKNGVYLLKISSADQSSFVKFIKM